MELLLSVQIYDCMNSSIVVDSKHLHIQRWKKIINQPKRLKSKLSIQEVSITQNPRSPTDLKTGLNLRSCSGFSLWARLESRLRLGCGRSGAPGCPTSTPPVPTPSTSPAWCRRAWSHWWAAATPLWGASSSRPLSAPGGGWPSPPCPPSGHPPRCRRGSGHLGQRGQLTVLGYEDVVPVWSAGLRLDQWKGYIIWLVKTIGQQVGDRLKVKPNHLDRPLVAGWSTTHKPCLLLGRSTN